MLEVANVSGKEGWAIVWSGKGDFKDYVEFGHQSEADAAARAESIRSKGFTVYRVFKTESLFKPYSQDEQYELGRQHGRKEVQTELKNLLGMNETSD